MAENGIPRPSFAGFSGMLSGQRIMSLIPRLKNNAMLMGRFMPNTVNVADNIKANKTGAATPFLPLCLSVGAPRVMGAMAGAIPTPSMGSFGGMGVGGNGKRLTIWGLFEGTEPQLFVTIREYTATAGATVVSFVEAEFAKANAAPMDLAVFPDDPTKAQTQSFAAGPGHILFTWQLP